jgi:8-oxo-dGTP pyrophosphatase MutT (NUDIX family)
LSKQQDYEGLSDGEFYQRAPKKRIAAGMVAQDGQGRILLVKPTYKEEWEIPGGIVDAGESPLAACQREIEEELGVTWQIGKLLVIDYVGNDPPFVEALILVFDGGVHPNNVTPISPSASSELSAAEWCPIDLALERVDPRLGRRLRSALGAIDEPISARYLEEGLQLR